MNATPLPMSAAAADPQEAAPSYQIGFVLLMVVIGVLFIRPGEIFPALEGLPIYNVVILACIVCSFPVLVRQLSWSYLKSQPAMLAVVWMLPAIALSHLVRLNFFSARFYALDFLKVLLMFLLICALVNSTYRLSVFIKLTVFFIVAIAALALLSYYGVINIQGIQVADRAVSDTASGTAMAVQQLYGPGIFNDPNDFSLILSTAILLLVHIAFSARSWSQTLTSLFICMIPATAFGMTQSRGGFLALSAGLSVLAISRFGWKRAAPLGIFVLPLMLLFFGGRMTNINLSDKSDTAQGRIMIWREGFTEMRTSPIFGIGSGNYAERVGHVAHNSFVHAFAELGLVGGTVFTAAFYIPISVLRRKTQNRAENPNDELERWRPAVLAVLVGSAVGLCSLSRVDVASTYIILALGAVYCMLLALQQRELVPQLNGQYFKKMILVGIGCFVFFNVFIRLV